MKRLLILILLFTLLLAGCGRGDRVPPLPTLTPTAAPTAPTPTPRPTPKPTVEPTVKPISPAVLALSARNDEILAEKTARPWMVGRLVIESADIDVALFEWGEGEDEDTVGQRVTDAEDSALVYFDGIANVIADHNNQDFATLSQIREGDMAYILMGDLILSLRCDKVSDGINTGHGVTDPDGAWATIGEDMICYTCRENWTNVLVVGFQQVDMDYFGVDPYIG